jgi:hypothetical protein
MGHKPDPRRHYPAPAAATPAADPPPAKKEVPVIEVALSSCKSCGSTRRSQYVNRREHEYSGTTSDGRPYTKVVWRRTRCLDCGQVRDDKTYE